MRILVAPDKFRGTLTAAQAARAFAAGWRRSRPDDALDLVPMADGGEGTMDALVDALDGRIVPATVSGPFGDAVGSAFGLASTPEGMLGVVEMARASGLALLDDTRRDPLRTSTRGTGELIALAIAAGADRLVVCIGGSATNDGGAGLAAALGVRLLDASGAPIPDGGAALASLDRIDLSTRHAGLARISVTGACDVDNPLTGPSGASVVYGPQKGATPGDVVSLDRALGRLAAVVERDLGVDLRDEPGAGAAGGLGFGLMAFCGATLRPGVAVVMEAVGLAERIVAADLVITGEGSLDEQSLRGKVPAGVLDACRLAGTPAAIVCGRATIDPGVPVVSLVDRVGQKAALADARTALVGAAEHMSRRVGELIGATP
ncbi:MAG TPA: glycerate kinase [Actinomycetota bacterium]|nr:glycerate kinase [Actinomycetota bacterium]